MPISSPQEPLAWPMARTCPGLALLERGLSLAEMEDAPLLLAPRDSRLAQDGFVREGVDALRAGWPMDPPTSESIPLQNLLSLAARYPHCRLQLMNLSTAEAVDQLGRLAEERTSRGHGLLVASAGGHRKPRSHRRGLADASPPGDPG